MLLIDASKVADNWSDESNGIYSSVIAIDDGIHEGLANISRDEVMLRPRDWNTDAAASLAGAPDGARR